MKNVYIICLLVYSLLPTANFAQTAEVEFLRSINNNQSASWDNTNKIISQSMAPVSAATPCVMFLYGIIRHDSLTIRNSYMAGASFFASAAITIGMKYTFNRPRPFIGYPVSIEKKHSAGGPSFPSGHTSSAFATAASLSLMYPKWYVIAPSFLWASAVGYSRMELGVHYPSDVFVGAIVGAGSAWLMWKLNKKLKNKSL